jgi:hypothetical protein
MGRGDIFMDNGKKAQGTMARYWKKQKEREKKKDHHPRERPQKVDEEEEQVDQTKVSSDKWKHHKMDMQMKKYDARTGEQDQKHKLEEIP